MDMALGHQLRRDDRDDAGWKIDDSKFTRFSQVFDVFNRSGWDDTVRSEKSDAFWESYAKPLHEWRKARGFRRRDFALRNAAWWGADFFSERREHEDRMEGFLDPFTALRGASEEREPFESLEAASLEIKQVSLMMGANLVGVAEADERWLYSERVSIKEGGPKANDLDPSLDKVIVIGQAMDRSLNMTAPSALAGAATGLGYSHDVMVLLLISQYIRNIGYTAVPTLNDTALAIPYAIKAGLGEYGRHGLVITPEYGTNVRFGKIFTDLPLQPDVPIRFGVEEMCNICRACSTACPSSAIVDGAPSDELHNVSNIPGITKWTTDGEACFEYWAKINSDCSVCVRVCPYTRDYDSFGDRLWARLAGSRFRRLALKWDERTGRGERTSPVDWWDAPPTETRVELTTKPDG